MISDGIRTLLVSRPAVETLVGDRVSTSSSPHDDQLPRIVIHVISDLPINDLYGKSGLRKCLLQINSFSSTSVKAWQLADEVEKVLGKPFVGVINAYTIRAASLVDSAELEPAAEAFGGEFAAFGVRQDYEVWYY